MKQKFIVEGMTCASCQSNVEKAIKKLNGVSEVNVNLLRNTMNVDFNEDLCSIEKIQEAVKDAGYLAYIKKVNNLKIKNDTSLIKLIVSISILLVLMYFSMGNMMWGWKVFPIFDMKKNPMGFALIQFILVLPIVFIYREYFIRGFKHLFKGTPNMDSLIAIGSFVSLLYGIFSLFMISWGVQTLNNSIIESYHMNLYFESCAMILVFVSLGKYLESISKKRTTSAITKLMDLSPKKARVLGDGIEKEVLIEEVKVGDICICKKGDSIPVDGIIIEGKAAVDQSNITGESLPIEVKISDSVYSSTTIVSGYIKIEAKKVGEDTSVATIIRLVEEASSSKAPISKLADRVSSIFVPLIIVLSIITFILNFVYIELNNLQYVKNAFEISLNFALTVIVIACPCALGLATPVAIMVGIGKGAENGLLIKNAEILEKANSINVVAFDKTGTITEGKAQVTDFLIYKEEENIKSIIYSLEEKSEHPLSNAIMSYFKEESIVAIEDFKALDGLGIQGKVKEDVFFIGNMKNVHNVSKNIEKEFIKLSSEGKTVLFITKNKELIAILAIKDMIKENSKIAIEELKKEGVKVVMISGDNRFTAESIAKEVGIKEVIAEVLPQEKMEVIRSLKKDNNCVAMVGDGVNDSLALTSADLGIALGGGSSIAIDSSDIILKRNDLLDVVNVIRLSKRVVNTIKLGLFWAFFYNGICVLLATGIFFYLSNGSFKMEPMYGAICMSISSISVVINALTINFFKVKKINSCKVFKEEKNMKKIIINVEGMMCMHCVKRVIEACKKVDGVEETEASLEEKTVSIVCDEKVSKSDIEKNIIEEGYEVK